MKSKDFLNELSPATLASYKKKAGAQASELDKSAFDKDTPADVAKKQIAKANKRFSGIVKATKKEFDKPKEVEEGQIYSGGNKEAGVHWYKPRTVPNQNELEKLDEKCWDTHKQVGMKKKGNKMVPNCVPKESAIMKGLLVDEEDLDENLRKWFKEKWVRFGPDGKIRGACARGSDSEGKPKCLPQAKAHALGKKGRKYAAAKKRREDPNPERKGPAKNVATKKKSNEAIAENTNQMAYHTQNTWDPNLYNAGFTLMNRNGVIGSKKPGESFRHSEQWEKEARESGYGSDDLAFFDQQKNKPENVKKSIEQSAHDTTINGKSVRVYDVWMVPLQQDVSEDQAPMFTPEMKCPHCGNEMVSEELMNEKKDACYYKVKSRYKVWPSAYASGALVKCRKKGAKNWGTGGKKNESIEEGNDQEFHTGGGKGLPFPGTYEQETLPYGTKGQKRTPMIAFEETQLDEKWSEKYKRSINCNNPKGFSQRAHCQGRKKK